MTEKSKWPQWLRDADTSDAIVQITQSGRVIWFYGVFLDGVWHGGVWRGGVWHGGVWHGGVWRGGVWRGGVWHGGDWRGGVDNPTRAPYRVRGHGDIIKVGCWTGTIAEARALCEDGELPRNAPRRDSPEGKLLRRAVLAQIAWQEAAE